VTKPEIQKPDIRNEPARPTPPPVPKPVSKAPPTMSSAGEVQPWSRVPEAERTGLPPLRVNIHVYTPDETQRILYIDNQPRVRGEELAPGVIVDEIVPEGAIIRFRGQRYLLPRPT
jgi:general secretion pathway protein B